MSLAAALLVGGIGMLIGMVGLGGFLLVPVLMLMEGASVHDAVVSAAVAFLASGVVALVLWRRGAPDAKLPYRAFLAGAAPGAMLGALLVDALVDDLLVAVIATALVVAGIAEWLGLPRATQFRRVDTAAAAGGGLATGFGSALTGTSGPMVAMPLLAWVGTPLRARIALGQVAQVPVALGATLVFAGLGDVPWSLAGWSGAALCAGLVAGAQVAPRVELAWLRRFAAVLMLGAAVAILLRH
jgi:uncharacterized membrane protein YfcA